MTQKLRLTPKTSYMLGMYVQGTRERIGVTSKSEEVVERFVKLAMDEFGVGPNRILFEQNDGATTAFFYNSKLKRRFDQALERRERLFKYRNEYSGNYIAGIFDMSGARDKAGLYFRRLEPVDALILEKLGIHTTGRARVRVTHAGELITLIREYSLVMSNIIR